MDISPLIISIKTALTSTVITFVFGIIIAYKMTCYKGKYQSFIDTILTLPLILPPTVVGFFLLIIIGKNGPIGILLEDLDINLIFTWSATVISAAVVSFPIMYRTSRGAFEQIDEDMISAARTLGLSNKKIFLRIIIPLAYPGIISATVLSFARALGEFGATLMIAGNIPGKTQTMPIAIFFAVESGDMNQAMLWVLIIIGIASSVIVLSNLTLNSKRRKFGKGN
ncbi:MAG: molybdate ABC transporter permease subunit [Paraclostridium sordellii]|uniref:molybdate ABC transporter permease subunit n=1 Tax=Paraclostridium sordellii TaxID=1505 RepID=UPI000543FD0D|nr:molybdate ABC transporter permease subunit [Paeniclostridium sordellii]MRZ80844.1 molybdate ABC transporter permease subunit [Paeniclostridium sordellii]MSB58271.1 molybdate ABC transporter permease subunit [Paeniclostridium sordellii]CEK32969.1 molybdenum ABC transporter permease,Molybdenum transport system permease protein modB,molybdate ABC transporter permease protein,ABC-type molybdate transport system, permease component,molybdate ABC transporter, permease protein,Binding-protein-depend